ncbi:DUF4259 domain-containing protein [Actinomadura hibisca]|uniref:DUF4259 domain-containing protein n=1 Tax=Actinomadura hibisca TaxID=68565 RepID=UPI00082A9CCF|nr:DUF4259 domain-containing protein [Actinomadura hibisca]
MGTWGPGAFDNDHAADFAGTLDTLPAGQHVEVITQVLETVVAPGNNTSSHLADPAVAAAAVIAAQLPGGSPTDSIYGPEKPLPPLPHELALLAVRALDRIVAPDSQVKELWAESPEDRPWHDGIAALRHVLAAQRP